MPVMMSTLQTTNPDTNNLTNSETSWQTWQMSKKRKLSGTPKTLDIQQNNLEPVPQQNRFELLADINNDARSLTDKNMDSQEEAINIPPRIPKPPPIFIYNVTNYAEMAKCISNIVNKNDYICKALANSTIKINISSIDAYRKLAKFLKEKNVIHHTYQLKQERAFRVVIRHLHHSVDIEDVKSELLEKGFEVRNMINIRHKITKEPMPLFFVDLEPNEDNKLIYKISYLQNCKIIVEPPNKNRDIPQCTRCQSFFHTKTYCCKPFRCVKCTGSHDSALCTKPKDTPAECVNCSLNHPANYRGCATYKEIQKLRGKQYNKLIEYTSNKQPVIISPQHPIPPSPIPPLPIPPSPIQQVQNSQQRQQTTYATIVRNDNSNPQPNDIYIQLTSIMNEFKTMFNQLINQNSMILNLLTKVINSTTKNG